MNDTGSNPYGWSAYRDAAAQISAHEKSSPSFTLVRMLTAKAAYGLSATEYALFHLYDKPFSKLADYRNKKQTTALFDRVNPAAARATVEDKLTFHRLCVNAALPVPRLHAVLSRRPPSEMHDVPFFPHLPAMLENLDDHARASFIIKPRRDALGTGVRFIRRHENGTFSDLSDKLIDPQEFTADLQADMERDDYLVQEFVAPHEILSRLGSGKALGTVRIVSWSCAGTVQFLYALLRIPCGETCKDNFVSGATGNLIANADLATGRLGPAWGRRDQRYPRLLEAFENNPESGQPIVDVAVPHWNQICETVRRAASVFAELPLLGWDVAVTERGVVLIEANSNPDIIGAQICMGVGARTLLAALSASNEGCTDTSRPGEHLPGTNSDCSSRSL